MTYSFFQKPLFFLTHKEIARPLRFGHELFDGALHAHGLRALHENDIPFLQFSLQLFPDAAGLVLFVLTDIPVSPTGSKSRFRARARAETDSDKLLGTGGRARAD